jgi:predicted Rossmann-fold nucleotide-binding protein
MGSAFWDGMIKWLQQAMVGGNTLDPTDLDLFHVTDDPERALDYVTRKLLGEVVSG